MNPVLPSGLPPAVGDQEEVARSITSSSWIAASKGRIKHPAFLPAPDDDTSVFRCSGLSADRIRTLIPTERVTEHGAAVVRVDAVRRVHLDVVAAEPPARHANIRGWPVGADPDLRKAERKRVALGIAEAARHVPWPRATD